MSNKKLLFSVTVADCDFKYTKGSGPGGQKRNKTSNAVHCIHQPSGARGYSESTRSQRQNKEEAFYKMSQTDEFKKWHKLEVSRRTGELAEIEARVKRELETNICIEVRRDNKWVKEGVDIPNKEGDN